MTDEAVPVPDATAPQPVDRRAAQLQQLVETVVLRGQPYSGERCGGCSFYRDRDAEISYCRQPALGILVGADWWCQWWEPADPDPQP